MEDLGNMTRKRFVLEIIETFLSSIIILFLIYMWIAMPEVVWGASMEPNYFTGERILVEKITKLYKDFGRGEVVVLNPPGNNSADYIKRIVGMPGDIVKIFDCKVYIFKDSKKFELQEDYLPNGRCTGEGTVIQEGRALKVPADSYMVLGDNREVSADSRYFGFVKRDRILGRVIFRFWPINRIGFTN